MNLFFILLLNISGIYFYDIKGSEYKEINCCLINCKSFMKLRNDVCNLFVYFYYEILFNKYF